ncbi:MAG: hypothetical protein AAFP82_03105 [Bacteroidota bacterium]
MKISSFVIFCLALVLSINIQAQKTIVIGNTTPLQKKVIGGQSFETKAIRPVTPLMLEQNTIAQLNGVDMLFVNVKQFTKGTVHQNEYVKEAMARHIPIVLENVDRTSLSELAGVGLKAKVVIVQSKADKRGVNITIVEDEPDPSLRKADAADPSEENTSSESRLDLNSSELTETRKTQAEEEERTRAVRIATEKRSPNANVRPMTIDELSEQTKEAIRTNAQKAMIDNRSGSLVPDFDAPIAANGPNPLRFTLAEKPAVVNNLPKYAEYHIDLGWSQRKWNIGGYGQEAKIDLNYNIVLYASTSPMNKWLKITTSGSGVHPGSMKWNKSDDKGFYTEKLYQQFGVYHARRDANNNRVGTLHRNEPQNVNNAGNISTTTGFSM